MSVGRQLAMNTNSGLSNGHFEWFPEHHPIPITAGCHLRLKWPLFCRQSRSTRLPNDDIVNGQARPTIRNIT